MPLINRSNSGKKSIWRLVASSLDHPPCLCCSFWCVSRCNKKFLFHQGIVILFFRCNISIIPDSCSGSTLAHLFLGSSLKASACSKDIKNANGVSDSFHFGGSILLNGDSITLLSQRECEESLVNEDSIKCLVSVSLLSSSSLLLVSSSFFSSSHLSWSWACSCFRSLIKFTLYHVTGSYFYRTIG